MRAPMAFGLTLAILLTLLLAPPAAGAPDPGGDEQAELAGPPAGKELGFNDGFELEGHGTTVKALLVRGIGGNTMRMPMQWWDLEPERDRWDEGVWNRYRKAYDELQAAGVRTHLSITHAPPWAREAEHRSCLSRAPCNFPPARSELDSWGELMTELARRFPEATLEVWNEPNMLGSWRSGVDPERYAELLAAGHEAVKAESPSTQVMSSGLDASPDKADGIDPREFLERAYAAEPSLEGHADAIGVHVYPDGLDLGAGSHFARVIDAVREVRADHDDETPLYFAEVGGSTSGPNPLTEPQQAELVMRATRKLLTMPDVSGVLVSRLVESPAHPESDPERGLGVMRHTPLAPKLAYCDLTRANESMHPDCAPRTSIVAAPPALSRAVEVSFSFVSLDAILGFECSLDWAQFEPCSSPTSYSSLPEGAHTFRVRSRGLLGLLDPFPARHDFTLDRTPPTTEITGPSGPVKTANPSYQLSASKQNVSFECALGDGGFKPCASHYSPGPLAEGEHLIRARAIDAAGNVDPDPAELTVIVDLTPPQTEITVHPPAITNDPSPRFEFSSNEPGSTFRCALDSWQFEACESPHQVGPLADGGHALRVQAIDPAGNVDPEPAWFNFTVDTVAPAVWITSGPAEVTDDPRPIFRFSANDQSATEQCRIGDEQFGACSMVRTHQPAAPLAPGEHVFEVRVRDRAGNLSEVARHEFAIEVANVRDDLAPVDSDPTPVDPNPGAEATLPELVRELIPLRRNRVIGVRLRCRASEDSAPCEGHIRVRTRNRVTFRGAPSRPVLAARGFRVAAGQAVAVTMRLSRPKARLVRTTPRARRAHVITVAPEERQAALGIIHPR